MVQQIYGEIIATDRITTIENNIASLQSDMGEIKSTLIAQTAVLSQILTHVQNIDKFIGKTVKKEVSRNEQQPDPEEDYDDLDSLRIKTSNDLKEFENSLLDSEYVNRFIRYIRSKFPMNGYQNGCNFFNEIMRLLTDTELFLPFSWKGINRIGHNNLSFKGEHPIFVKFILRVVKMSDHTKNDKDVELMFENLLRFKKIHDKREKKRNVNIPARKPGVRIRLKRENAANDVEDVGCLTKRGKLPAEVLSETNTENVKIDANDEVAPPDTSDELQPADANIEQNLPKDPSNEG